MRFKFPKPTSIAEVEQAYEASPDKEALANVQTYCTFLGYPFSGHTLVGSILDAHPNMVLAHELHALSYIKKGFRKELLFHQLLENSRKFTDEGRTWNGYGYLVPNQWQGRYRELRVIGDKKGGGTTEAFMNHPGLFDELARVVPIERKFIHVVRNPFDNISTIQNKRVPGRNKAIEFYFSLADTISRTLERLPANDVFTLRHEDFVQSPKECLHALCGFLGEETTEDYLNDCASIVREKPSKTRLVADWSPDEKLAVQRRIESVPFLNGYSFES